MAERKQTTRNPQRTLPDGRSVCVCHNPPMTLKRLHGELVSAAALLAHVRGSDDPLNERIDSAESILHRIIFDLADYLGIGENENV